MKADRLFIHSTSSQTALHPQKEAGPQPLLPQPTTAHHPQTLSAQHPQKAATHQHLTEITHLHQPASAQHLQSHQTDPPSPLTTSTPTPLAPGKDNLASHQTFQHKP